MLRRTIALALLAAAAILPASAATTAYDRAASMATGETSLGKGYDGADAAGTVKASAHGHSRDGHLRNPENHRHPQVQPAPVVPAPERESAGSGFPPSRIGLAVAFGAFGALAGSFGGPLGAVLGAALGFGIALMLSKLLS